MRRTLFLCLLSFSIGADVLAGPPANFRGEIRNGKPVYTEQVTFVWPTTLDGMYATADDVVEVRISSRVAKGYGPRPHVRTYYTARVNKAFKGSLQPGSAVTFSQFTGELELPDKILQSMGREPIPLTDDRYIVFLRAAAPELGGRILVGEIEGAFRIKDGRIDPLGTMEAAGEQRNLGIGQFEDELNRLGRRGVAKPKV